ncbi:MAG: 3-deoxy-7-phosphoheptulonate synthase [Coriobacteriia bacterium]|nr:3-deoxy-7-phosphoheptulonate synthase [Coriobacteriia bacterium]MCL2536820.1 3-deoxy-7-phosphoheptulonate synthase [Coriobacteriia bacterium]
MIIILSQDFDQQELDNLITWLENMGLEIHMSEGANTTIMGLVGDTSAVDINLLNALDCVADVKRIQEPFKKANRKFHPQDTVISLGADGAAKIGGGNFMVIAGPCSVESPEQISQIAAAVKDSGAQALRGGAFKPRTSPYAFQGMQADGIELLLEARKNTGLPIVTEIMDLNQLEFFDEVDVIQVGARNMQNFVLLRELGKIKKPILLKRGFAATIEELLMSAEYLMAGGNEEVILCERGVRTFEPLTRNTLDLSAIPIIKELSHLPVVVDPSHATGVARYVRPMSLAAVAAGADGLMVEVHNSPKTALCDGQQSITPLQFDSLAKDIAAMRVAIGQCNEGI